MRGSDADASLYYLVRMLEGAAQAKRMEFQSRVALCEALCAAVHAMPCKGRVDVRREAEVRAEREKEKEGKGQGKEGEKVGKDLNAKEGLRVAPSGALLLTDLLMAMRAEDMATAALDEGARETVLVEGVQVFVGLWAVLTDLSTLLDDSLALKALHELTVGLGMCVE